jgi:hypothetical protein
MCLLFRVGSALHQQIRLTESPACLPYFWMAPIKDLLDALIWAGSFLGNHVIWRGQRYRILSSGKLASVEGR